MLDEAPACKGARSALKRRFLAFWQSDAGIATIEWVALAGGLVIGAIAVAYILMVALGETAIGIASQLSPSP
jgi:hypothetical protein